MNEANIGTPMEQPVRILVVDDEPNVRAGLVRALNLLGYHTESAASGPRALNLLETAEYDLMILDMRMPEMEGTEVMTRAHQLRPTLLMIVLTGHATLESAIAAVKSHAVDYILKPIKTQEISQAVARALAQHSERLQRQNLLRLAADALHQAQSLDATGTSGDRTGAPAVLATSFPTTASQSEMGPQDVERFITVEPLTLDRHKRLVILDANPGCTVQLTEGEADVLSILMAHPEQVFSCRELVRRAWQYELEDWDAVALIRHYIFRLRQKLKTPSSEIDVIRTIRGRGYTFTPPRNGRFD